MATKENKQRKLSGFLSTFYRSTSKLHKPKDQIPPPAAAATAVVNNNNKHVNPQSFLLKKLENCQALELQGGSRGLEREFELGAPGGGGGDGGGGKIVEGRKSVSHVETNLPSVVSFLQVKVLVSDMPGFMQVHAFRCARRTYDSLEKFSPRHMAYNMKKFE
ncbi:putative axonemal dynein light chain [Corchorus capsularis]|uniref:Putative axonemal dynein light chain n=1 Tax=Corchorus capsularis TaxID=210143 RepID=A0A1R3GTL0_COCAP|nr:putative axonemal dynein light chain [Corchorus capsularis]